jgi:hypothetical protein
MDPDPGGPKTRGSGSGTLPWSPCPRPCPWTPAARTGKKGKPRALLKPSKGLLSCVPFKSVIYPFLIYFLHIFESAPIQNGEVLPSNVMNEKYDTERVSKPTKGGVKRGYQRWVWCTIYID